MYPLWMRLFVEKGDLDIQESKRLLWEKSKKIFSDQAIEEDEFMVDCQYTGYFCLELNEYL